MRLKLLRRHKHDHGGLVCQEFVELVTDYLEGTLPERDRACVEAHLALCDGCSEYLEQMRATVRSLGELPAPPVDDEVRERLLTMFREVRGGA